MTKPRTVEEDGQEVQPVIVQERQTVELCSDERDGKRCVLDRGHSGLHEAYSIFASYTWS